jgi:hypothetical protein
MCQVWFPIRDPGDSIHLSSPAVKTLPGLLGIISDLSTLDHRFIPERGAGILPQPGLAGGLEVLAGLPDASSSLPEFPGIFKAGGRVVARLTKEF